MTGTKNIVELALCLSLMMVLTVSACPKGYNSVEQGCVDDDECALDEDDPDYIGPCGEKAKCINTEGSFYCQCEEGYRSSLNSVNFSAETSATCRDINECYENKNICGPMAVCYNTAPLYSCICEDGFISSTGEERFRAGHNITCRDIDECEEEDICGQNATCVNTQGNYTCVCKAGFRQKPVQVSFKPADLQCEDICLIDKTICGNGTCHHGASGHYCSCHAGFTNYGSEQSRCTDLNCDVFEDTSYPKEISHITRDLVMKLRSSCVEMKENGSSNQFDKFDMLKGLMSIIDQLLSRGALSDNSKVSILLHLVENALKIIGAFTKAPRTKASSAHTDVEMLVHKGMDLPKGQVTLSSNQTQLDIKMETAAGDPIHYPGFAVVSLLSYGNLEESTNRFFSGMTPKKNQRFKMNSKVVTVTVSNIDTTQLDEPVNLTLYHLIQTNQSSHTCVFWDHTQNGGTWSTRGCTALESNAERTVCSCNHLSSFAVLMALYDIENKYELQLITQVGLSLSSICLFICILTFSLIRAIKSPRTTIHLHLCISLFIASLLFLTGISHTENKVGCAVVAGLLHFFFLAAFCWMCLEGVQLFRMVILVFNTSFKTLYMMAGGYGVPAVIVTISALVNAKGYGTKNYCWLNLDFIWSFLGPVCVIIIINIFFFLITVWKLAQKFTALNPDLNKLQKIKAFTITAVAQLCVLGTMWIFGCFQFQPGTIVMSYLFTILGSLQGVLLFLMHCVLSKQVREEYGNILSRLRTPQKKTYSDLSNSQSSKAHATKSTQDTGESHM